MPKKILLADDSITIQKVVELTFSDGDYEVVAVNNGAKAIQKLSEMRPDIILSDIIMPEKNGYEVCEFVKSHPEFRTIPVVLLTGTFEPFDPDRADKAGCDAVVTKPFESQSLILKVEELIAASQTAPAAAPSAPEPAADSPWAEEPPAAPSFAAPPAAESPFGGGFQTNSNDIFSAAPSAPATAANDMPFETAEPEAFSGETRAFPRMSFEDMQRMANESAAPPAPPTPIAPSAPPAEPPQIESSPWDEPAPSFGGGAPSFDAPAAAASPFGEEQPAAFSGETKAFPRMSFEELQQMASQSAPMSMPEAEPAAPAAPESSPWEETGPAFGGGGETRAMPPLSFDAPPAAESPSPFSEPFNEPPAAFAGETRAFPAMSFDELSKMADSSPAPVAEPEPEAPRSDSSLWSEPEPTPSPAQDQSPFAAQEEPEAAPQPIAAAPEVGAAASSSSATSGDLSEEQIERIARRVVEMLSADVVKNIAWEVIPDMAEMVVKERIRQLESEA